jgi:hypothetical protein
MRPGSPIWELERTEHSSVGNSMAMGFVVTALPDTYLPTQRACNEELPTYIQARTVHAVQYSTESHCPRHHRSSTANTVALLTVT